MMPGQMTNGGRYDPMFNRSNICFNISMYFIFIWFCNVEAS